MRNASPAPVSSLPHGGRLQRRWSGYRGLFTDEFDPNSAWIRESAEIQLPPLVGVSRVLLEGYWRSHPSAQGVDAGFPTLTCAVDGRPVAALAPAASNSNWEAWLPLPASAAQRGCAISLRLRGVGLTNSLAWAGRVSGLGGLQRFRGQNKNRQLRVARLSTDSGEVIYDFSNRHCPYLASFARKHARVGVNVVGFLTADLGIGESARCMVRAAGAAGIPAALIDLKLNVKNRRGDLTYADRLVELPEHDVSIFHLDPPAARDLDHHHGRAFRRGRYNIGYWAWELPEFPDSWAPYFDYFDEIWCPSEFVREAIALRSPIPVLAMPHAIRFPRPQESLLELRAQFGLPPTGLLFLFLYDLNSYSARKNPTAVIEAFRRSGLAQLGAHLVVKTHSREGNEAAWQALQSSVAGQSGIHVLEQTLSRQDLYRLEAACDVFVSLHRSEGFGLALAECMYLGKPVIGTDWSATAEFLTAENGCPVPARLVTLEENVGPYSKGQTWAEPDIDAAAQRMVMLANNPGKRLQLGAAARRTIETQFAPERIGARYRRRLEAIATR